MQNLFKAIYTRFLTANSFRTAIGGRFYNTNAPQGATLPFCVYEFIGSNTDYSFTSTFDYITIQFTIIAEADQVQEIMDCHDYLTALFDDCTLSVSGYQFGKMERELEFNLTKDQENNTWSWPLQYEVWLRK